MWSVFIFPRSCSLPAGHGGAFFGPRTSVSPSVNGELKQTCGHMEAGAGGEEDGRRS